MLVACQIQIGKVSIATFSKRFDELLLIGTLEVCQGMLPKLLMDFRSLSLKKDEARSELLKKLAGFQRCYSGDVRFVCSKKHRDNFAVLGADKVFLSKEEAVENF